MFQWASVLVNNKASGDVLLNVCLCDGLVKKKETPCRKHRFITRKDDENVTKLNSFAYFYLYLFMKN